ncbi:MAG: response regulator, partial [bacterium]|nr:response regulator [bacterium]
MSGTKQLIFLFTLVLLILPGCRKLTSSNQPLAKEGILDLRNWDIDKDGPVKLIGEVEFYWKKLPGPDEKTGFVNLPSWWNKTPVNGQKFPNTGYAAYRFTVLTGKNRGKMAIKMYNLHTAFTLHINGEKIASNGVVATTPETGVPESRPLVADFFINGDKLEIIIRVSNFHHAHGGASRPIILGRETVIREAREREMNLEFFLLGSMIIMALYHLGLFLLRRSDKTPLYFAFCSLYGALFILFSNECYFTTLFPFFDWFTVYNTIAVSGSLEGVFIVMYLRSLFPEEYSLFFLLVFIVVMFFHGLLFLVVPGTSHENLFLLSYGLNLVMGITLFYKLILALIRKREGAGIVMLGGIIIALALLNDSLYDAGVIESWFSLSAAFFFFIFAQAYLLSRRFSKAFFAVEQLTASLEQKVEERTGELKNANEKLKEMDRAKTNLFTNISHELRTPLTLITSPIESIINGDYGNTLSKEESLFKSMHRNGLRLLKLINNLLDFSKIDAGRMLLSRETTDIVKLLEFLVSSIHSGAASRGLDVRFVNNTKGLIASIDRDLTEKALYNLISNAMKFTPVDGTITITLNSDDTNFRITVSDTGIGIPEDKLEAIFERFTQVDASLSRKYDGTGIGLSLTKEIVDMHNGTISAESSAGNGAQFTISLPLNPGLDLDLAPNIEPDIEHAPPPHFWKDLGSASAPVRARRAVPEGPAKTILIVDDNLDMLSFLQDLLEKEYRVITAANGLLALSELRKSENSAASIALVLSDVMMPEMDGYELTAAIRREKKFEGLPIILLTAKADTSMKVEGISKGANDYIAKPFNAQELLARVRSQVELKELRDRLLDANDRLKQTLEDSSILVSHVGHKFHNQLWPFAQMMMISKQLLDEIEEIQEDEDAETFMDRENVEFARETLERCGECLDTIEELKAQVKRNFGKSTEKSPHNIYKLLEQTVSGYTETCAREHISIEGSFDIEPDREIKINADQVSIALENIINNAVHALVSVKDPGREKKIILGA